MFVLDLEYTLLFFCTGNRRRSILAVTEPNVVRRVLQSTQQMADAAWRATTVSPWERS
jgi:hypothetical protein